MHILYGLDPSHPKGAYFQASMWQWPPMWEFVYRRSQGLINHKTYKRGKFSTPMEGKDHLFFSGEEAEKIATVIVNYLDVNEDLGFSEVIVWGDVLQKYEENVAFFRERYKGWEFTEEGFQDKEEFRCALDNFVVFMYCSGGFVVGLPLNIIRNYKCFDCGKQATTVLVNRPFCRRHYKRRVKRYGDKVLQYRLKKDGWNQKLSKWKAELKETIKVDEIWESQRK